MKRSELKQLIKEEIQKVLNENQPKSKKDLGPKYKKGDKIVFFYYAGERPGDSQEGIIDRDPRPSRHLRKGGWEYSVYGLSNWIHEDDISDVYTRIIQKK